MKFALLFLACLAAHQLSAQYYYQDILASEKANQNFAAYKAAGVKRVMATSFEKDGSETENFGIEQVLNERAQTLATITKSDFTGTHQMLTFFGPDGKILSVIDSGVNIVNKTTYQYTLLGKIAAIATVSFEPTDTNRYTVSEQRIYQWNIKGQLTNGLLIKNGVDTTAMVFSYDLGSAQPAMEKWYKRGQKTETWYYYYDEKGRLTDIVRYNERVQKMLPDYVFEYNADGKIEKQIIIQPGSNFYRNIVYEYNDKGLKAAESIFYKSMTQEGRVVFTYE
jgi:hypothetical protein